MRKITMTDQSDVEETKRILAEAQAVDAQANANVDAYLDRGIAVNRKSYCLGYHEGRKVARDFEQRRKEIVHVIEQCAEIDRDWLLEVMTSPMMTGIQVALDSRDHRQKLMDWSKRNPDHRCDHCKDAPVGTVSPECIR